MDEEFLTVAEVAALLKLNEQTVRNWIDAGKLPALRVGRRIRIRRADLTAVLNTGATVAVAADAAARERLVTASGAVAAAAAGEDDVALAAMLDELADAAIALAHALRHR